MPVVAIFGPTASGKSAVALGLAERLGGEIVSCDAMQLYRGLPILTNQPSAAELAPRAAPPGRRVGRSSHAGSVAEYARAGPRGRSTTCSPRGRTPVVVRRQRPLPARGAAPTAAAAAAAAGARGRGSSSCTTSRAPARRTPQLAAADPAAAAAVHPNDRRRVVRALELHAAGASLAPDADRLWARRSPAIRRP